MRFSIASETPVKPTSGRRVHRPSGILPCPCCHREMCAVEEVPGHNSAPVFYVVCTNSIYGEHEGDCTGTWNGPVADSVREAVRMNNERLVNFSRLVLSQS